MTSADENSNVSRETVAAEVRAQLGRHRRSARSVALELGWSQNYMWRRVNGDIAFNVDDLIAIAGVLGIAVTDFFPAALTAIGGQLRKQHLAVAA